MVVPSGLQVIFLVGLVTMILMRTLRKDYARYSKEDEIDDMERDLGDEYGWKQVSFLLNVLFVNLSDQVHGDVFRAAASPMLFSSLIGTGAQLAVVVLFVVVFAIIGVKTTGFVLNCKNKPFAGELYTERGSLLSTTIFVYAATAPVSGYFGGSLYARMGGKVMVTSLINDDTISQQIVESF